MTTMTTKTNNGENKTTTTPTATTIPGLNITTAIILWLVVTTVVGPYVLLNTLVNPSLYPNKLGWILLGFNNLNILIAICEIILGLEIKQIRYDYQQFQKMYGGDGKKSKNQYQAAFDFLMMPLNISTLFNSKTWSKMWSTYSLWDPSYSNQESFGFFIDVGNGWSTILPCIVWNIAIVYPTLLDVILFGGPNYTYLWVGVLGCCSYWQILYGTIIYFVSFIFNERYKKRPLVEVLGFVGVANGIWFVFPIIALYASVMILKEQNLSILFVQ